MSSGESTAPTSPAPPTPPPPGPSSTIAGSSTTGGRSSGDWPAQAADAIVELVDKVRRSTTGPLLTGMRGVVYGTAIVVLALTAAVLAIIGAIRALNAYLPGGVWAAYFVLGMLFTAIGLFLWSRRYRVAS